MEGSFLTFLGVSIVVMVAPGPDTALTIRNTFRGGRASGISTALGMSAGQLIWAVATSVGLAACCWPPSPSFARYASPAPYTSFGSACSSCARRSTRADRGRP